MRSPTEKDGMRAMRPEYRAGLAEVDMSLVALAEDVAGRIAPVGERLLAGDATLPGEVAAWYAELEGRCADLEDACFVLVARQAPVAADLREIFAVMRSVHEVLRSGKLLRHIAETLEDLRPPTLPTGLRTALLLLTEGAGRLFNAGVDAWRSRDGLAINELEELDDEVDRLQAGLLAHLYLGGHESGTVANLVLLARWYERIADHGVEIGRHVSWAVTGHRVEPAGSANG